MLIAIQDIPEEIKTLARGYARGDQKVYLALLLRNFELRTLDEVAGTTGIHRSRVNRLAKGFSDLCEVHRLRRLRGDGDESNQEAA